jgi:site-specific recombinase XerD
MDELVKLYLEYYRLRNALSSARRLSHVLNLFIRHLQSLSITSLSDLDKVVILHWFKSLHLRGVKPITILGYGFAVSGFCCWLYRQGYLLVNPFPDEQSPRRMVPLPRAVPSVEGALELLNKIRLKPNNPLRDLAILELCYGCGLRKAEVQRLNVSDIKGDSLRVVGKGNKERVVPLGKKALSAIFHYKITERKNTILHTQSRNEALFLSAFGNRLSLEGFSYLMRMNRPKGSKITLHSLRHACATHMLQKGASVRVIQKLLGHSKISSTQVYTRLDTKDLKTMLERYHPRK